MNVIKEVKNHLRDEDPAEVCGLLDITSEDLVDRFDDRIEDKLSDLQSLVLRDEFVPMELDECL